MKKLFLLIGLIILSNCEIKPRTVEAQSDYSSIYSYREETRQGMLYGVWYVTQNTSQTGYAVAVVNLTKEKLEVELLKKQLSQ